MKIEIKVGNISSGKRVSLSFEKFDNINSEKKRMYDFLINCKDCVIENVDNFLLYTLNNGLMAYIVKDNVKLQSDEYIDDEYHLIPKLNPDIYRVFEIKEDGTEISLQDDKGNIGRNYFNILMGGVMDDYYDCLNFYETSIEAQK
jgi:hypothetical protein